MTPPNGKEYAAAAVYGHLKTFLEQKQGVLRARDIEYLHRMRVAGRRLSNSLWAFRPLMPQKKYKALRRSFSKITKSLGAARDLDTYIAFLLETKDRPEFIRYKFRIGSIILSAKRERLKLKNIIEKSLKEIKDTPGLPELKGLMKNELSADGLLALSRKKIARRLKGLLSFRKYAKSGRSFKKLHALRIAAKHLRYTLENFNGLYRGRLTPYIQKAHLLQDYLGDMHNYHVWAKLAVGFKPLKLYCRKLCRGSYELFYREWEKQRREKTWTKLNLPSF